MFRALVTFAVLSGVLACPDHSTASHLSKRQAIPWNYDEQDAWANNHPFCANANGVTYYLLGFHTHIISEHTIDGQPHAAEIHLVHGDASGAPIGVVGFPLAVGSESGFFEILPSTPGITSTDSVHLESWDMSKLLAEGNNLKDYWSYEGSLTTPDCAEGKRWWVSGKTVTISQVQLDNLLKVSAPSARKTQQIIDQGLNI
ncbi:carbonic anhydrase [Diplocarpon rosae]|nr:carbonic anhydrase [Diplocarpon rosae]